MKYFTEIKKDIEGWEKKVFVPGIKDAQEAEVLRL